jgi:outer membrane protein assembly factor BamD
MVLHVNFFGDDPMKLPLNVGLMVIVFGAAGCSSISLPSLPWSSSSATADPTAEALFEVGMRAYNDKKYVRAIDALAKIKTDYPFTPLLTQVELKVADAYYLNEQYPEAVNAFKEFQTMHPTNENMPFVTLRLGQAHFDQFSATERDQKNTEIAKGYFEKVLTDYPKSPQAAEAKEKLAKALEYLAEHEFSIAQFYLQQEKFPAARDRFEEIIRKYKATPTAVKSLFFLGESYRQERNGVRAALAYEALLQHYPQSKYAAQAKIQLAVVEKEKRDPLELVLMRDRRPGATGASEAKEDPALAKLRDLNLVTKKEVVYEEPGEEKGLFRRVVDKINPFSSSGSDKTEEKQPESALDLLAKKNQAQKSESSGFLSSLWPFGSSKDSKESARSGDGNAGKVLNQVDEALKQKGIDSPASQTVKAPEANLPKVEAVAPPKTDTVALLSSIDANLKKSGKDPEALPAAPEAAAAFRDVAATQEIIAKAAQNNQAAQNVQSGAILNSIDQKLKAQGLEPVKFDIPPTAAEIKAAAQKAPAKNVELAPKLAMETGPLFLNPAELSQTEKPASAQGVMKPESKPDNPESDKLLPNRILVKGPVQAPPAASTAKPAEAKKTASAPDDESKGALEQIRQDIESIGKALNPFRW